MIKTFFRMLGTYAKMDLLWFLRDTRYCLIQISADIISAVAAVSGVFLLSEQFGGFGGMSKAEVLFMLGYSTLVDGIFLLFFGNSNTGQISRIIGRGQLDHNMLQPVPLWMQLLTEGFSPFSGNSLFLCGGGLTIYAMRAAGLAVSFPWCLALAASLVCSVSIVIAVTYLVSSLAFYAPAAAEEISGVARELFSSLKSYPLGGLSAAWKTVFCTFVPVGLAAWFPSAVLLNKVPDGMFGGNQFPALTFTAAAVLVTASTLVFKKGMKHYAKDGCPRYSGFGHR